MLNAIVGFSLRFRGVVIALAICLIGYGLHVLGRSKFDVFPEFAPPLVTIQTESPGLSPEQVELLVTQPIENAVNGVAGIETLRSNSIQGLSVVTITFRPGGDIYLDRQQVAERLASVASSLPRGIAAPVMTPLTSSTSTVLVVGLTSEQRSPRDLRTVADWTLRPRILSVPGVAKVSVFGGEVEQIQVQVDPDRLVASGLAMEDVLAAAARATGVRGAGFVDTANQRLVLQTEAGSPSPERIGATVLSHHDGASLTLGDVARVVRAGEPPVGAAAIEGKPGVILSVSAQLGSNTVEVTDALERALTEVGPALERERITLHPHLFRPANFIATATGNLRMSLLIGAVLVVVVLFLFLANLRTAAISWTAIPLSLLAAVIVLDRLGHTLNTMTLSGLAIALGLVVDDAVIDVENILRRLRENRSQGNPRAPLRVVFDASIEVRSAIVYATFALLLVFLPVLTLSGIAGRLFAPLGIAYIFAVLASLVVALTVTPALCLLLLGERALAAHEPRIVGWLKERYRALLLAVERHPNALIVSVALVALGAAATLPLFGTSFLPELREGHFIVHMAAVPGTSLEESLRLGRQVTAALRELPAVRSVAQRVGRAEATDDTFGTHYSEMDVDLKPLKGEEAEFAQSDVRNVLARFPGVNFAVKPFLTERIEETLSGYTASVVVNIYASQIELLDRLGQDVARALAAIPGASEVQVQSPPGNPTIGVALRDADVLRFGFQPGDVLDAVRTAFRGDVAGQVYAGNRVVDVSVVLAPEHRKGVLDLGNLPLRSAQGTWVTLRDLATIHQGSGRYVVLHDGSRRVQTVTCNVAGRDVGSFTEDAKKRLAALSLPEGAYVEVTGAAEAESRSRRDLLWNTVLAGLGVVLLLSVVTANARNLALVLVNLPLSLIGGVLAVFATGGLVSLGSLVGFVTLFGITMRNSIMMVSHYEHLVAVEGQEWGLEAAMRGASERLVPILMTALVTALGLLPLAIGSGDPGREVEGPMAMVILGGLASSTVLNLLLLPTLALRIGKFSRYFGQLKSA